MALTPLPMSPQMQQGRSPQQQQQQQLAMSMAQLPAGTMAMGGQGMQVQLQQQAQMGLGVTSMGPVSWSEPLSSGGLTMVNSVMGGSTPPGSASRLPSLTLSSSTLASSQLSSSSQLVSSSPWVSMESSLGDVVNSGQSLRGLLVQQPIQYMSVLSGTSGGGAAGLSEGMPCSSSNGGASVSSAAASSMGPPVSEPLQQLLTNVAALASATGVGVLPPGGIKAVGDDLRNLLGVEDQRALAMYLMNALGQ
jgi:hypothetical protein